MADLYDFNPVSRITVGVLGKPGHRSFFLQASQDLRTLTVKLEKEQVFALARGIDALLEELEQKEIRPISNAEEPSPAELALQLPVEPAFVAGQMGLAFDPDTNLIVLVIQELPLGREEEESLESTPPVTARFWASLGQMRALSRHAQQVVAQGRPICPLCQRPMDPEGHFCPRRNGHAVKVEVD